MNQMRAMMVVEPGPMLTVQDLGRPGLAALGVPESGALDQASLRLANRLVGNDEAAAGLEATLGGVVLQARGAVLLAVTGAPAPVLVDNRHQGSAGTVYVADGSRVEIGRPTAGLRSYVAVRGGIAGREVLGSSSTDLLAGVGAPLVAGDELGVGPSPADPVPSVDHAVTAVRCDTALHLRAVLGPRDDWFTDEAVERLAATEWTVGARSNRIGVRLEGGVLDRAITRELASEGTVAGAIQVPGNGVPVLFLADHPVTGGYPVIAVVVGADLPLLGQAAPGTTVRLYPTPGPDLTSP